MMQTDMLPVFDISLLRHWELWYQTIQVINYSSRCLHLLDSLLHASHKFSPATSHMSVSITRVMHSKCYVPVHYTLPANSSILNVERLHIPHTLPHHQVRICNLHKWQNTDDTWCYPGVCMSEAWVMVNVSKWRQTLLDNLTLRYTSAKKHFLPWAKYDTLRPSVHKT